MTRHRSTPAQLAEERKRFLTLWRKGLRDDEIARQMKRDYSWVGDTRRAHGLPANVSVSRDGPLAADHAEHLKQLGIAFSSTRRGFCRRCRQIVLLELSKSVLPEWVAAEHDHCGRPCLGAGRRPADIDNEPAGQRASAETQGSHT